MSMSIGSVGSSAPVISSGAERMEGPGPDQDGDRDDVGAAQQAVKAAVAPGIGQVVDKTA